MVGEPYSMENCGRRDHSLLACLLHSAPQTNHIHWTKHPLPLIILPCSITKAYHINTQSTLLFPSRSLRVQYAATRPAQLPICPSTIPPWYPNRAGVSQIDRCLVHGKYLCPLLKIGLWQIIIIQLASISNAAPFGVAAFPRQRF